MVVVRVTQMVQSKDAIRRLAKTTPIAIPRTVRVRKQTELYQVKATPSDGKKKKKIEKKRKNGEIAEKKGKGGRKRGTGKVATGRVTKKAVKGLKQKAPKKAPAPKKKGNERLTKRDGIKIDEENPFLFAAKEPDFVSISTYHRHLLRAILREDTKELKKVMSSNKISLPSADLNFSYSFKRSPDVSAFLTGRPEFLSEFLRLKKKSETKKPMEREPNLLQKKQTGRPNFHMLGVATRAVEMTRGGREGVNALLNYEGQNNYPHDALHQMVDGGMAYKDVVKMVTVPLSGLDRCRLGDHLVIAARRGHRAVAHSIAENEAKYSTNDLHRATLSAGAKLPDRILPVSVVKKSQNNRHICPLHTAAINPDPKVLERLRTVDPNINVPDQDNWYTVHYAAVCESSAPLKLLLKSGVSVSLTTKKTETPLHVASRAGRTENIKILLDAMLELEKPSDGAEELAKVKSTVNARDRTGKTALHLAVENNHLDTVRALLSNPTVLVDQPTSTGKNKVTPLMFASSLGLLPMVRLLIEKEALIEARDKKGRTALIHAVINGQRHVAAYLLSQGATMTKGDTSANSVSHYAAAYGWLDCLQLLAEVDPSCLSMENDWKITPLSVAYLKGHYGIVAWLLDGPYHQHVDINGKDEEGVCLLSSLLRFADSDHFDRLPQQIDYLLERGANCDQVDSLGNTIMHDVAALGIRMKKKGENGKEGWIEEEKWRECFEKMIGKCGQAVTMKNQQNMTPLHVALSQGNLKMFTWLLESITDPLEFFSEWSPTGTILHDLLSFPVNLWNSTKYGDEGPPREEYDSLAIIKGPLMNSCQPLYASWLQQKNNNGLEPLLQLAVNYEHLKCNQDHHGVVPFSNYIIAIFIWAVDKWPASLTTCSSPLNEFSSSRPDDVPAPARTLVHSSLNIRIGGYSLLKTLLIRARDHGVLRQMLLLEYEGLPVVASAVRSGAAAARLVLRSSEKNGCVQGVHDVVVETEQKKTVRKTLLMKIIESGSFELVDLLQLTEEQWTAEDYEGNSAWHYAARSSHHRTTSLLKMLEAKGVPRKANHLGSTPLHVAVQSSDGSSNAVLDPVEWLAAKGGAGAVDKFGRTPLHYAFGSSPSPDVRPTDAAEPAVDPKSVTAYLQRKAARHAPPVATAASTLDPIAVVSILVAAMDKEQVCLQDDDGNSALHCAAARGATVSAVTLIRHGADVKAVNKLGNTPLATAVLYSRASVALALIQANSDVTTRVVPKPPVVEKKTSWKWSGAAREAPPLEESTIPAQIVSKKGDGWPAMVYVLLDALGKNVSSMVQLAQSAMAERQFNLANQLLKSLENVVDGQPLPANQLIKTFAEAFRGLSLEAECVERVVLDRILSLGCSLLTAEGACPALEIALEGGKWPLALFIKSRLPAAQWQSLVPSEGGVGPMGSLLMGMKNDLVGEQHKYWLSEIAKLTHLDALHRALSLALDVSFEVPSGPIPPLAWAAVRGLPKVIRLLIDAGADSNSPDVNARTPLMYAVMSNNFESVEALCGDGKEEPPRSNNNKKKPKMQIGSMLFSVKASRKRKANWNVDNSDSESDQGSDDESDGSETGEDDEVEDEVEAKKKGPNGNRLRIRNKNLNLLAVDNEGRSFVHYLVSPNCWENCQLLAAFLKEQPVLIKQLLVTKDKSGQDPNSLALSTRQNVIASAMMKAIGAAASKTYTRLAVTLPPFSHLVSPHDVSADSALFMASFAAKNDKPRLLETRPHPVSGYRDTGVLEQCPETNQTMSVLLNKTDVSHGRFGFHNFYRMELIKRRDANLWILFTNWGRIGLGNGEHQTTPFQTLEAGIKEFKSVWKAKTGQEWCPLDQFQNIPKKYRLVQVDKSPSSLAEVSLPRIPKTEETDAVRAFVADISEPESLKQYMKSIRKQLHVGCPFGRVTAAAISRARDILGKCTEVVRDIQKALRDPEDNDERVLKLYQKTNDLSSEFYSEIPLGDCEYGSLLRFDDEELIKRALRDLNRMDEIEVATRLLTAAAARDGVDRIDYIRSSLECDISAMGESDPMSQNILQWIHLTKQGNREIKGILSITSRQSTENFAKFASGDKQMYLFHGTKATNLLSILKDGFLVDPCNAQMTGRAFGEGVYFADTFEKSVHYCRPSTAQMNYMLVCQVAVGKMAERDDWYEGDNLGSYDTLLVQGAQRPQATKTVDGVAMPLAPLCSPKRNRYGFGEYSEYIVRDSRRILPRYIIMFK